MILVNNSAFAQNRFLWPLPNSMGKVELKPGNIINPITGLEVTNDGYFISAKYDTDVYAVEDGIVVNINSWILYTPDMQRTYCFPSLEFFKNKKQSFTASNNSWFCEANLMSSVSLKLKDGTIVHYTGLIAGNNLVEKNKKVKKGDVIGKVGYFRVALAVPSIKISMSSSSGKVADIGVPLLGENNKLEKQFKPIINKKELIDTATLNISFEILRKALEEGHPSLYKRYSQLEFSKIFAETKNKLNVPLSRDNFMSLLMSVVAQIGCSHTYISKYEALEFENNLFVFPLAISYVENNCIVVADYGGKTNIPIGTIIKEIDGLSVTDIVVGIKNLRPNDVRTDSCLNNILVNSEWFNYYLKFVLHGIKDTHKIKIIKPNSATEQTIVVKSLIYQNNKKYIEPKLLSPQKNKLEYKILDKDIAYLSIQTCTIDKAIENKISKFVDSINVKNINTIILDLRYNLGGKDISFLLSVLGKSRIYKKEQMVNSDSSYLFFKYTDTNFPGEKLFSDFKQIGNKKGYWLFYNDTIEMNKTRFEGKIYVLVSAFTQSSATILATDLYKEGAIIVGEETGGSFYSMNALTFTKVMLKGTGLILNLPLVRTIHNNDIDSRIATDRGLIPHFIVHRTINSVVKAEDNQLDYCIQLIRNKK